MIQKMFSRVWVLVALTTLLAACSQPSEYIHVIPADTSMLISFDLKSLSSKSGLTDKENEADMLKVLEALKSGTNAATFQQMEKVLNNPSESGIDVDEPVYLFTAPSFNYLTAVAKVTNADNLKASIDAMAKEQICQPIAEADGYSFTTMNGSLLAFNGSTAMLVVVRGTSQTEEAKGKITALMQQTSKTSVSQSGAFKNMKKQKGDIHFFASFAAIPAMYRQPMSAGFPAGIQLEDLAVVGGVSFEKGKIAMTTTNYTENDTLKALIKKQEKAIKKVDNTFVKYFPASTLAFFSVGVKGEGFYEIMSENEGFNSMIPPTTAADIKNLFNSFDGDISVGLTNVTMSSAPTFVAYAEVTNSQAIEAIYKNKSELKLKKGEDIVELSKGEYVYKANKMNLFFGVKGKQMYVTNDEMVYKNIDKAVDKSIKEASYASEMKSNEAFAVVNIEAILALPIVKMAMGFGGEEVKTYFNMASKLSYLAARSEGGVGELDLCFVDQKVNALKQIVDFAKQFAGM